MEVLLVIIGLFIFAAVLKNKDISRKVENQELCAYMVMVILMLILGGLGFIFPASTTNRPNQASLLIFLAGCAAMSLSSTGLPKIISRVAWAGILAFIILGSFY